MYWKINVICKTCGLVFNAKKWSRENYGNPRKYANEVAVCHRRFGGKKHSCSVEVSRAGSGNNPGGIKELIRWLKELLNPRISSFK